VFGGTEHCRDSLVRLPIAQIALFPGWMSRWNAPPLFHSRPALSVDDVLLESKASYFFFFTLRFFCGLAWDPLKDLWERERFFVFLPPFIFFPTNSGWANSFPLSARSIRLMQKAETDGGNERQMAAHIPFH